MSLAKLNCGASSSQLAGTPELMPTAQEEGGQERIWGTRRVAGPDGCVVTPPGPRTGYAPVPARQGERCALFLP